MDSLAQDQALRIIAILESILCFNLLVITIQCNIVAIAIGNGLLLLIQLIYNCDFHSQRTIYRSNARICGSAFSNGVRIFTNLVLIVTQNRSQLHSSSCSIILIRTHKRFILCCSKHSIRSCTINRCSLSLLYNRKAKSHTIRSSTLYNMQRLGQNKIVIALCKHLRISFATIFFDTNRVRCRRKRCGCADGEHHGGSQNAREEFLQFHCYSSLVRNSSYSCAAAQTPRFTGRKPAASSGLRGITDCVAAVV